MMWKQTRKKRRREEGESNYYYKAFYDQFSNCIPRYSIHARAQVYIWLPPRCNQITKQSKRGKKGAIQVDTHTHIHSSVREY